MKQTLLWTSGIVLLAGTALAAWFMSKQPHELGVEKTSAVLAPVHIYRDAHGIPHIFAEHLNDGYAALGYLHAGDRLFQMEMMRRAGTGRLAEILGPDLVNYDKKMRALGFYARVEDYYKSLLPDARAAMDAYARGVNAYMDHASLPAEFTLLGFAPAPWNAWDGLIWAKMMAWQLSGNMEDEILREQLAQQSWSREKILALYPRMDSDVPSTLKPLEWVRRKRGQRLEARGEGQGDMALDKTISPLPSYLTSGLWPLISSPSPLAPPRSSLFFDHLPHTASNAYVIAGVHTQTGKPILANDPHLQLQSPILWYLARIVTPQGELKGATAPGIPFFPLGQNSDVAWGFTTSNIDVQDITFIDAATSMTVRHEVLHVKGAADIEINVEENKNGVVLSGIIPGVTAITPQGKKALLQFTGFSKTDRTAQALFEMNTAKNVAAIESAIKNYSVPPQNLVYADKDGHVGYKAVGLVPKRDHDGFWAEDNTVWRGWMETAPQLKNPSAGVILTANQAVVNDKDCAAFSCAFARDWSEPYRAMRLEEWFDGQFSKGSKLDIEMAQMPMLDITSKAATRFLPLMLNAVSGTDDAGQELLDALRVWDGRMQRERPEPLIYHVWLDEMMRGVYDAEYTSDVMWPRMWALEAQHIPDDVTRAAWNKAKERLFKTYGANWRQWRWGDAHRAPLKHPLWSHVPVIGGLSSLDTETDGDGYTLRRAAPGDYNNPFAVEHGAGYRGIYDLADPAQSRFIIAGGQSGQIFTKHYGNLRDIWNAGDFVRMTGSAQTLLAQGAHVLTLQPQVGHKAGHIP